MENTIIVAESKAKKPPHPMKVKGMRLLCRRDLNAHNVHGTLGMSILGWYNIEKPDELVELNEKIEQGCSNLNTEFILLQAVQIVKPVVRVPKVGR